MKIFAIFRISNKKNFKIFFMKFFFNLEKIQNFVFKISTKIAKILHPMHLILSE